MASDQSFAELVSLACHDLRTPLATAHGFARTLERVQPLEEKTRRYIGMIEEATAEMVDLLERLSLLARIEGDRYEPALRSADSLELARTGAARLGGKAGVTGEGVAVMVDPERVEDALRALAECALRHGGLEHVEIAVSGARIAVSPTTAESAPVLIGEELRDVGAAVARRVIEALGGSVSLEGESVVVRLPT